MIRKFLVLFLAATLVSTIGFAEARRTIYTRENKLPELHQLELGATFFYQEIPEENLDERDNNDRFTATPYARFGLFRNLNVYANLPVAYIDRERGDNATGLGDVTVGFELLAWEDIFRYPYILPHAEVSFPTGDEDEDLGTGKTLTSLGVSIGTTVYDVLHYVADATYTIYQNEENVAMFSGSILWDLDERFSLLAEGRVTDEQQVEEETDHPVYLLGGMSYKATERFVVSAYGGGSVNGDEDVLAGVKASFTF